MKTFTRNGLKVWRIESADRAVRVCVVPEIGAAVSSLEIGGRELLYQHPHFWEPDTDRTRGGFPFLFPVCGRLERNGEAGAYLYDGRIYRMKIHGFSTRMPWAVSGAAGTDGLTLTLRNSDQTRELYPFRFAVTLRFRALPDSLVIEQEYANTGDRPMPYYAGFHPFFATPGPDAGKARAQVDFRPVRQLAYNERLTDIAGVRPPPAFPASVCDPAINEVLTEVGADKTARLIQPDGFEIRMAAEGVEDPDLFRYIQLYTMPERPFFCIEPWMAFPNALNAVSGSRWLAPGQKESGVLRVSAGMRS